MAKYKILIVDDAEYNRALLADILCDEYEIMEASDGMEAVALLNKYHEEIQLILLDIVMPVMDGFDVLAFLNKSGWIENIPVITISAETSSVYIDHAYDLGAIEYISRPFDEKTVKRRVKNTIMLYAKQKMLEGMVTEQILEKEKSSHLMVEILSNIVEFRNGESGLHVLHIRVITEMLLRSLVRLTDRYSLSSARISLIINASALHDIGKISIPESILNKPGRLTAEEFGIMKTHSAVGARILANAPYHQQEELVQIAEQICRWHHERYDGRGYPDGLKGEEIPVSAQVVSLADVYDALTSKRVYKEAYSHDRAMRMIREGECGAFNPILLKCLEEIAPRLDEDLKVRSVGGISKIEIQHLTGEMLQSGNISNRTLALLEQERTKYQFFASMSRETQFEYNKRTDLLTLSEFGARQLGVSEIIADPRHSSEVMRVFTREDYEDFRQKLISATHQDPIVTAGYYLCVGGQCRWYKAVARPLWVDPDDGEISGFIGKLTDEHDEHERMTRLQTMSERDSLTRLYNHLTVRRLAEERIRENPDRNFALFLLDVDLFKSVNDRFGHLFGDKVLRLISDRIRANLRPDDLAARVGGDEFLLFIGYDSGIEEIAASIFRAVGKKYDGFSVAVSVGVSLFPLNGREYEELFQRADHALYWAKKNGKRRYVFYDESMREQLSVLSPIDN